MLQRDEQEALHQRELVRTFDEKLCKYTSNGMEPVEKLFTGFFIVILAMIMLFPYDSGNKGVALSFLGFGILPVSLALGPKVNVTENGKQKSIYQKLKYLPISKKEIRRVRMEYVVKFLRIPLMVALAAQLIGAWAFNGRIGIENIIYPLVAQGALPFVLGILMTYEIDLVDGLY